MTRDCLLLKSHLPMAYLHQVQIYISLTYYQSFWVNKGKWKYKSSKDFVSWHGSQQFVTKMNTSSPDASEARDLTANFESHSRQQMHKCNQCEFASVHASKVRTHLKTHSGGKSYKCSYCDYAFVGTGTLRKHLKTHADEKSYICNQCDFASVHASTLKGHLKTHSSKKIVRMQTLWF